ncbi:Os11g0151100 [Oryza sativa Japonica Group]|uniref:Os11g0151100 protein n=1 Tax=Oryza sativa subsp. japonica TaxID=39947 RepID=Q0IUK7_ORYSJ|nr:Os11g0151100 [Oryza sativa Japonica Group]|eukprot:NP_001065763.2 Os11g0151100 [Oryza sativa Japonica Group]
MAPRLSAVALAAFLLLAVVVAAAAQPKPKPAGKGGKPEKGETPGKGKPEERETPPGKGKPEEKEKPEKKKIKVKCQESRKLYPYCSAKMMECPDTCPTSCFVDCDACKPVCVCNVPGACGDPRFIGGDGNAFYFHGRRDADFCVVSDRDLHINAHFIGKRGADGMSRDFTWIQAIAVLFDDGGAHRLYVGARKTAAWDDDERRYEQRGKGYISPSLIDLLERGPGGAGGGNVLGGELALGLVGGATAGLAVEDGLAVLVELEFGDDDLGWVDPDVDGGPVHLLPGDALDMDHPPAAVDLHHLALAALVAPPHHLHLVVLADGMERTLYLWRSSVESAADMRTRRTDDGAVKCAFRHLRRELVTRGLRFMAAAAEEEVVELGFSEEGDEWVARVEERVYSGF